MVSVGLPQLRQGVRGRQGPVAANPQVVCAEPSEAFWGSVSPLLSFSE